MSIVLLLKETLCISFLMLNLQIKINIRLLFCLYQKYTLCKFKEREPLSVSKLLVQLNINYLRNLIVHELCFKSSFIRSKNSVKLRY